MTAAELSLLSALIEQHARASVRRSDCPDYSTAYYFRATSKSAQATAQAILDAGFSMASRPVDDRQDADVDDLRLRLTRLEGWAGLPRDLLDDIEGARVND